MPRISKSVVDSAIRANIFAKLNIADIEGMVKINDRQFGCLVIDENGVERYARIGVIVAEERDDCTARELMESEIAIYNEKQAKKAAQAQAKREKIERDKAKREAARKEKEQEQEGD